MVDPVFARNPEEAERLSRKHVAIIGCGSGGSAIAAMTSRAGVGRFTLVDPDVLALENVGRHMLSRSEAGKPKVLGIQRMIEEVNSKAEIEALCGRFEGLAQPPDLLVAATDSFSCQSLVNSYSLQEGIPAVYGGCWGEASVGEILYVVPGKTPCYECYASFRRGSVEIPADPRKYTDPDFDATKTPGQAGLWANILVITGVMFQVVLGLLDPESERNALIDYDHTLFIVNVTRYDAPLQPLAVTFGRVKKGCMVCDKGELAALGRDFLGSVSHV
jgi:hypothetical protein